MVFVYNVVLINVGILYLEILSEKYWNSLLNVTNYNLFLCSRYLLSLNIMIFVHNVVSINVGILYIILLLCTVRYSR